MQFLLLISDAGRAVTYCTNIRLRTLAERGGKNGEKRAVIATARKLAVLLHRLWVSGEVYEPLRKSRQEMLPAAA
jgi:hypothetical protein